MSGKSTEQSKASKKRFKKRKGMCQEDRPILESNAAGIDVGAREMFVAVPPDRDAHPVRVFDTLPRIYSDWPTGWSLVESPLWRWNPPACIGFRCTTFWKRAV